MKEDTQKMIGKVLDATAERDAIHVAVAPVIADAPMEPGTHCGVNESGRASFHFVPAIGIVDPFLLRKVTEGERFFLFLYPNTVTGLRHHWLHPAFDAEADLKKVKEAREWMQKFCDEWHLEATEYCGKGNVDKVLQSVQEPCGGAHAYGNTMNSLEETGEEDEFWRCVRILTGKEFSQDHKDGLMWTCSC